MVACTSFRISTKVLFYYLTQAFCPCFFLSLVTFVFDINLGISCYNAQVICSLTYGVQGSLKYAADAVDWLICNWLICNSTNAVWHEAVSLLSNG